MLNFIKLKLKNKKFLLKHRKKRGKKTTTKRNRISKHFFLSSAAKNLLQSYHTTPLNARTLTHTIAIIFHQYPYGKRIELQQHQQHILNEELINKKKAVLLLFCFLTNHSNWLHQQI